MKENISCGPQFVNFPSHFQT